MIQATLIFRYTMLVLSYTCVSITVAFVVSVAKSSSVFVLPVDAERPSAEMSHPVPAHRHLLGLSRLVSRRPTAAFISTRGPSWLPLTGRSVPALRLRLLPRRSLLHPLPRLPRRMLAQLDARQLPVSGRRQRHLPADKSNATVASYRMVARRLLSL